MAFFLASLRRSQCFIVDDMFGDVMTKVAQGESSASNGSMIVPGAAFLGVCGIVTYHHATQESYEHAMSHFLIAIFMQMLPLLALKMKIYACGDRLSLVPKTLVKTLLMHAFLSILRVAPQCYRITSNTKALWNLQFAFDAAMLVACFFLLRNVFGFQWSLRSVVDEREVRNLVLMGVLGAAATEVGCTYIPENWLSDGTKEYIREGDVLNKILFTAANYVDVLAFMPVVWKLYQAESDDDYTSGTQVEEGARKQVLLFFAFVVGFYSWDDVIDPIRNIAMEEPIAMMAHAAHFVLLLDFACFFIFQVWTPSSAKGEQLQGLLQPGSLEDGLDD